MTEATPKCCPLCREPAFQHANGGYSCRDAECAFGKMRIPMVLWNAITLNRPLVQEVVKAAEAYADAPDMERRSIAAQRIVASVRANREVRG